MILLLMIFFLLNPHFPCKNQLESPTRLLTLQKKKKNVIMKIKNPNNNWTQILTLHKNHIDLETYTLAGKNNQNTPV
jgi:hypothetical protein